MALELKITSPSPEGFVKEIIWNSDELSAEIEDKIGYYKTLVYTDKQVLEAKKDRATLNKFISALKDKDREIKKLCLAPYDEFHAKMTELIKKVEEPAQLIDKQVKAFEEDQKAKKKAEIEALFKEKGFQPWVTLEKIWDPKWINKSYSMKQIDEDMSKIMYKIGEDIFLINRQNGGIQAGLAEYKRSLNVVDAVNASTRFVQAQQAEAQVIGIETANEEFPGQVSIQDVLTEKYPDAESKTEPIPIEKELSEEVPIRKEIFFKVFVSRQELAGLNTYLKSNGIIFRQIKEHN